MNIVPDLAMVAWQMAPFLTLMVGLHFLLLKPMLGYLHEREHVTEGAKHEAHELAAKAEARLGEWEQAMAKARAEVVELRSARRADANAEYQRIVGAARAEADKRVAEATGALRGEADTARAELKGNARALAQDVATQVLGRPVRVEA
ncbi:MAG: ATP synthase F0 subunit B [Myxococcota bacterium]